MPIGAAKLGVLGAGLVPGGSVTFNASGTWPIPPGVKKVSITGIGGSGNPGNSGTAGNAGQNGLGGGGGSGGGGDARDSNVVRGAGGGIYTTFGPGIFGSTKGSITSGPGPFPNRQPGAAGPTGSAGSGGSAGSAGSAGNAGQASSGLCNTFPGGAGGNAGAAGNAGNGGGGGPGGSGGCAAQPGGGLGGSGGTGGGAGARGGTGNPGCGNSGRPGPCAVYPNCFKPFYGNALGGGGGGGAGATNDGQVGRDSNSVPNTIFQCGFFGQGTPGLRGGVGGTTTGFSVTVTNDPNPGLSVPAVGPSTSGGYGGGIGNCSPNSPNSGRQGSYAFGAPTCDTLGQPTFGATRAQNSGSISPVGFRIAEDRPGPPQPLQPQFPMQNLGLTRTNSVVRSGGGGGAGTGSTRCNRQNGAGGGGGGGGRGGAGNAGGAGGAGGTGGAGTPQTFNCVPVTPGGTAPITVASPGGQIVISWNPQ